MGANVPIVWREPLRNERAESHSIGAYAIRFVSECAART